MSQEHRSPFRDSAALVATRGPSPLVRPDTAVVSSRRHMTMWTLKRVADNVYILVSVKSDDPVVDG